MKRYSGHRMRQPLKLMTRNSRFTLDCAVRPNSAHFSTIELCPTKKRCFFSCTHHSTDFSDTCFLFGDSKVTAFSHNFQIHHLKEIRPNPFYLLNKCQYI